MQSHNNYWSLSEHMYMTIFFFHQLAVFSYQFMKFNVMSIRMKLSYILLLFFKQNIVMFFFFNVFLTVVPTNFPGYVHSLWGIQSFGNGIAHERWLMYFCFGKKMILCNVISFKINYLSIIYLSIWLINNHAIALWYFNNRTEYLRIRQSRGILS